MIEKINSLLNGIVWGPLMQAFIIGTGLYFTLRLGFFQITGLKVFILDLFKPKMSKKAKEGITSFQAFATALGGSLGIGNIAGVATAISVGGPGAIFWMWFSAFFGMMTKYAEIVLAVSYRQKSKGELIGGPMYYIEKGLGNKMLAILFAFFAVFASFGIGNIAQINSVSASAYGGFGIPSYVTGVLIAFLAGVILIGGTKRIAKFMEGLVPLMALFYMISVIWVLWAYSDKVPYAFGLIFKNAFSNSAPIGGFAGAIIAKAIKEGMAKGVFSNEAGLGSTAIAYAAANNDNPVKLGILGIIEVFVDTMVVCSATALVILATDAWQGGESGMLLAITAFNKVIPFGGQLLAVAVTFFGFASMIAWAYYGQVCISYMWGEKIKIFYKLAFIIVIYIGSVMDLGLAWSISDTLNGLMAIPNLISILILSNQVFQITKRYK